MQSYSRSGPERRSRHPRDAVREFQPIFDDLFWKVRVRIVRWHERYPCSLSIERVRKSERSAVASIRLDREMVRRLRNQLDDILSEMETLDRLAERDAAARSAYAALSVSV